MMCLGPSDALLPIPGLALCRVDLLIRLNSQSGQPWTQIGRTAYARREEIRERYSRSIAQQDYK